MYFDNRARFISNPLGGAYTTTHDWQLIESCPPNMADSKEQKVKKIKLIDRTKQGVYAVYGVLSSEITFILCSDHSFTVFWPDFVRGKLKLASSGGLGFRKYMYTPQLQGIISEIPDRLKQL